MCSSRDVQASTRKLKERNLFRWPEIHLSKSYYSAKIHEQTRTFRSSDTTNLFNLWYKVSCFLNSSLGPTILPMITSMSPLNSTSFSILYFSFTQSTGFVFCIASTLLHIPVSPLPFLIRLSSSLLQQNSSHQSPMASALPNSFSPFLRVLPAFNTLDYSQLILKILFHSSGFPADSDCFFSNCFSGSSFSARPLHARMTHGSV